MPTVIAIDASVSMFRFATTSTSETSPTLIELSQHCALKILDHLSNKSKLEHTALLSFSSTVEEICQFTRDYDLLKSSLSKIVVKDTNSFSSLISFINGLIAIDWGCMELCKIIVITDGRILWQNEKSKTATELFDFPAELYFMCLDSMSALSQSGCLEGLEDVLKQNKDIGSIVPLLKPGIKASEAIPQSISLTEEFLTNYFSTFTSNLCCGNLKSKVTVFPSPVLPSGISKFNDEFQVIGFLNISDIGNPPVISRHLLLPIVEGVKSEGNDDESGLQPSFSVLLHASLKVENKVAIVRMAEGWFGVLHSWADSKAKSNLVLSLLSSGYSPIPWIGDFRQLGPASLLDSTSQGKKHDVPSFPIQAKKGLKRSYAQPTVAWTRATGLQTDVQKILRSTKKLPEKSQAFYKDLNRLRRAALSFGFHALLEGISQLLERECTLLPGTAHPEATLQLSHAARELKASINLGYDHVLEPLKTDFKFNK